MGLSMDLQDFNVDTLYFENDHNNIINTLLSKAAAAYASGDAERFLLQAYRLAPTHLSVLVGLYRYYFYQHRYEDALHVAEQLLSAVAPRIEFPEHWRQLQTDHLGQGVMISIGFVRFYLLVLKAAAYVQLRLGNFQEGVDMLRKVTELDSADRLGAKILLDILNQNSAEVLHFPVMALKEA